MGEGFELEDIDDSDFSDEESSEEETEDALDELLRELMEDMSEEEKAEMEKVTRRFPRSGAREEKSPTEARWPAPTPVLRV